MPNEHYVPTEWVNAETPTSAKMNTLDANIESGFEMTGEALSQMAGDDRVIDDPTTATEFKAIASTPADMIVNVNAGYGFVSGALIRNESASAKPIVAPTTNNRYTIIQVNNAGVITTKDSAEAGSPSEPSADADNMKLAAVYLPQNTTKIENSDGGFGYIIDRREPFALHPTTITRHLSVYIPGVIFVAGGPNDDGYYFGAVAAGFTFGKAVTIEKVAIQALEAPVGADLILTFHNITDPASDTATLPDGDFFVEDSAIDLDFDAADKMSIQVTQVGSGTEGGFLNVVIQYVMQ